MSGFLEAEAASFAIGGATLVDRIDLRIDRGELIAIVGPNGAGKSTLLRLLSGDLRPTRGAVSLQQRAIHSYPPRELASRRAMLSQHVNVSFPFTVKEVVWMGVGDRGHSRDAQTLVDAALHEVGLGAFSDRQLPTLSGGEQQRAHFARVLVQLRCGEAEHGPGLLLLDEPTSSLDLRHQIDLAGTARRCAHNGTTVIAILHDLNLAARFASRIVVLHQGTLAADGAPAQVIRNALITRVFDIHLSVQTADDGLPFLLPQMLRPDGSLARNS